MEEKTNVIMDAMKEVAIAVFGQAMFDILHDKDPNDVFSAQMFLKTNQADYWYDFLNIDRMTGHEITMRYIEKHGSFHPNALDRRKAKREEKVQIIYERRKSKLDKKRDLALQLVNHTEGV